MNFIAKYSLIFLSIGVLGCSESYLADGDGGDDDGKIEVSIGGSATSSTKATLADDLTTVNWESGDKIAVWAHDGSSYALAGQEFTMRYYNDAYTSADFSAKIDPMAEGDYTYYSVYPYPESYTNTTATFSLPATQSGEYDGAYTIMVATPEEFGELSESTMYGEPLVFEHKTHAFKIEIPDGCNNFGDDTDWIYNNYISGLDITFSQDVVGSVTVDVTDPDTATTLSAAGKTVEVKFSEPFQTGSDKYIWAFINPTTAGGDVTFMARASDGSVSLPKTTTINNALEAGHITPIKLTLPERDKIETRIKVILSPYDVKTRIGESLESVKFTLPDGVYFDGGSSSSKSYATADLPADSTYTFSFYDFTEEQIATLSAGTVQVEFSTANVKKDSGMDIALSGTGVTSGATVNFSVKVPYFLYTDFTDISSGGGSLTTSENASSAATAISGLTDWYGCARAQWSADGDYVSISSYGYYAYWGLSKDTYQSRVNSCLLSACGLQSDSSVTLKVEYDATWSRTSGSMGVITGRSTGTTLNSTISSSTTTEWGSTGGSKSPVIEITGATSSSRVVWKTDASDDGSSSYNTVVISSVKVTIVEEEE